MKAGSLLLFDVVVVSGQTTLCATLARFLFFFFLEGLQTPFVFLRTTRMRKTC